MPEPRPQAPIPYGLVSAVFAPLVAAYAVLLRNVEGFRFGHPWLLAAIPPAVALVLWVGIALARPQSTRASDDLELEGIDIVISLDLSGSMQETDLAPNRLEAAKVVIQEFVRRRPNDRLGQVEGDHRAHRRREQRRQHLARGRRPLRGDVEGEDLHHPRGRQSAPGGGD